MNNHLVKVNSVKEIKKIIDNIILPGYFYKTCFNSAEFLIDINYKLIIAASIVQREDKMVYEFVLDTQFSNNCIVTYDELIMVQKIIELFEYNRKFVLSRLKKYTVEEYEREQEKMKRQSEMMLKALEKMMIKNAEKQYYGETDG